MQQEQFVSRPASELPHAEAYKVEPFDPDKFKAQLTESGVQDEADLLAKSQTQDNLLGVGGNGNVYKIPGVEGYVLKVYHRGWSEDKSVQPLEAVEDRFPDMNLGQPVAHIGGGVILKEQHGVPAGVPHGEVRRSRETGKAVYHAHLARAAELPQSAYDQLAELFAFLNEQGMAFDPSKANNLLIDEENQRFNVVDLNPKPAGERGTNTLTYMVVPLMDNSYAWQVNDPNLEPELIRLRGQILVKSVEAAQKAKLPLPGPTDSSLAYSFTLAGMEDKWESFSALLSTAQATS